MGQGVCVSVCVCIRVEARKLSSGIILEPARLAKPADPGDPLVFIYLVLDYKCVPPLLVFYMGWRSGKLRSSHVQSKALYWLNEPQSPSSLLSSWRENWNDHTRAEDVWVATPACPHHTEKLRTRAASGPHVSTREEFTSICHRREPARNACLLISSPGPVEQSRSDSELRGWHRTTRKKSLQNTQKMCHMNMARVWANENTIYLQT